MKKMRTLSRTSKRLLLIPAITGLLFAALNAFPGWRMLENRLYDQFLKLKPEVVEHPSIVLLDIDEESIVKGGNWPWPRGLVARGMEVLAEIGAEYVVFDIEYLEQSPMSVDKSFLDNNLKNEFNTTFGGLGSDINELFRALTGRQISLDQSLLYADDLVSDLNNKGQALYGLTQRVAVENDNYLGQAMRLFGKSFVTLNMNTGSTGSALADRKEIARNRFAYPLIQDRVKAPSESTDFLVPIPEVSLQANNAGFTNVSIDADGVRRRIRLVDWLDDKYYLQLGLAPLLHWMGRPELILDKNSLSIVDAQWEGQRLSIKIPLDRQGLMLINWPKKNYEDSFRHVSFYRLLEYRDMEDSLLANLRNLRTSQVWLLGIGYRAIDDCITAFTTMDALRLQALGSGSEADRSAWLAAKESFRQTMKTFLDIGYGEMIPAGLNAARDADDPALAPRYDELRDQFSQLYNGIKESMDFLDTRRELLREQLAGSFNIIGWTGTATTDIGVNPFFEEYINVGTHAAVVNTIVQQDFLREGPLWISSLLSVLLAFGIVLLINHLKTGQQIAVGLAATASVLVVAYLIFHFSGLYLAVLSPLLTTFISFLGFTLIGFLISEREKSFLRKAFSTYLSGDIINELVADPQMLKLGGQKKYITAMFTDVRGFSTISEALDAEKLVALLNIYLSGMSDTILNLQGTIDKYEGDAIIAFFGAPLTDEQHALKACTAAIRMKQLEKTMNEQFIRDQQSPTPLLTRIGLNTGDMVVGNMGTEKKMNYTIMGNAVNLAARLEGVNKQYGSWILATDETINTAGPSIIGRKFDRVRVVGINTPVQLWEIIGLREEAGTETMAMLEAFSAAHELFEARDYASAEKAFGELTVRWPEDGPSAAYRKRSQNFIQKAPSDTWDGVFNLTEK